MSKHVHSADPRKPQIVAALKAASGGTKITNIREVVPNLAFTGDALRKSGRGFERLGEFRVELAGLATATEIIEVSATGEFVRCLCRNTVAADGFFPCNSAGDQVEPTAANWPDDIYCCARCGRIIHEDGRVVGRKAEL